MPSTPPGTAVVLRSAAVPGRVLAALAALAAALVAAFVEAPRTLASTGSSAFADRSDLADAVRRSFVAHWSSGGRELSPDLANVVDYWSRYHVAKAVIAAVLLVVLAVLARVLWRGFLGAGGRGAGGRAALASAAVLVTGLALFALVVVMANVQGAVAPYASLLPILAVGAADGELAGTLDQVRQRLAESQSGGGAPDALAVMVGDFARYHVAMAVIAAVVALALGAASAVAWRRFARTGRQDRRARRLLASAGAVSALLAAAVAVVAVANTTTAADSAPALLAFFEGGW
ncbi:hypothetical protein ACWGB8_29015 [Kitasatospora sp. NPDC054939]